MILRPKMRVQLTEVAFPASNKPILIGAAGYVARIGNGGGHLDGMPLVQFDNGELVWVPAVALELEPPREYVPPPAPGEAAAQRLEAALQAGKEDAERLAWLEEVSLFAAILITNGEVGGVYLSVHDEYQAHGATLRAAIDTARNEYHPED